MSMQPQPAAAPQEQPPMHQATGPAASKLHDLALGAEKNLEALATGLAQNHADPGAVKAVSQMADVMRKILSAMGKQAQAEQPPAPRPTMDDAMNQTMDAHRAAQQPTP